MSRNIYQKNIFIHFVPPFAPGKKRGKKEKEKCDNRWKDKESMWKALQKLKNGKN